jgi:arginase family enzyme
VSAVAPSARWHTTDYEWGRDDVWRACGGAPISRFPVVYGADSSVLLAAVPALAVAADAGLVFIDGHEDATPMELSASGEAANMEVALLLGLTGPQAPEPLRSRVGYTARSAGHAGNAR